MSLPIYAFSFYKYKSVRAGVSLKRVKHKLANNSEEISQNHIVSESSRKSVFTTALVYTI